MEQLIAWKNSTIWWKSIWIPNRNTWHAFYIPLCSRLLAFISLLLSILFLWSETTIWSLKTSSRVDLSPLSLWIHRQGMPNYSIQVSVL